MSTPRAIQGEGAALLGTAVRARSVDMVYIDPPFFTQQDWHGAAGSFSDRWSWDEAAVRRWSAMPPGLQGMIRAIAVGDSGLLAYLAFAGELVAAVRGALRAAGTLWVHCDDAAYAELRLVCDAIFGARRYWGEVIWKRSHGSHRKRGFPRVTDHIFVYARTGAALQRLAPPPPRDASLVEIDGVRGPRLAGFIDLQLNQAAAERNGWPTQKPLALLRELIEIGSRPGDLVVDPCCGSGTTLEAAWQLGRRALGFDISAEAVALAARRLGSARPHQADLFGSAA